MFLLLLWPKAIQRRKRLFWLMALDGKSTVVKSNLGEHISTGSRERTGSEGALQILEARPQWCTHTRKASLPQSSTTLPNSDENWAPTGQMHERGDHASHSHHNTGAVKWHSLLDECAVVKGKHLSQSKGDRAQAEEHSGPKLRVNPF